MNIVTEITRLLKEEWLVLFVVIFLLSKAMRGYRAGLVREIVHLVSMLLSFVIVPLVSPYLIRFLRNSEVIYSALEKWVEKSLGLSMSTEIWDAAGQRMAIEAMNLPYLVKQNLLENNNLEMYRKIGATSFSSYVVRWLTNSAISILSFFLVFVLVYILLGMVADMLNLFTRLPILKELNKLGGFGLGSIEGLLYVWIGCLLLTAFATTAIGTLLLERVSENGLLSWLYDHNYLVRMAWRVVDTIF